MPAGLERSTIPGEVYAEFIRLGFKPPYFRLRLDIFQRALEVSCRANPQACVEQLHRAFEGIASDDAKWDSYQAVAQVLGQVLLRQDTSSLTSDQKARVLDFLTEKSLIKPLPGLYESISQDQALMAHLIESFRLAGQEGTLWREENILRIVGPHLQSHPGFDPLILAYLENLKGNMSVLRGLSGSVFRPGALREKLFELAKANDKFATNVLQATAQADGAFREQFLRAIPARPGPVATESSDVARVATDPALQQNLLERIRRWKVTDIGVGGQIAALTPAVVTQQDLQKFFLAYLHKHRGNNDFDSEDTLFYAAEALKDAIAVHANLIPAVLQLIPTIANPGVQIQLVEFLYPHLRSSPEVERAFGSWLRSERMNVRLAVAAGFRNYPVPLTAELAHELAAALKSSVPQIQQTAFDLVRQFHRDIQTANSQVVGYRDAAVPTGMSSTPQISTAFADEKLQTALLDYSFKNKEARREVMRILADIPGASPRIQRRLDRLAAMNYKETHSSSFKNFFRRQAAHLKTLTRATVRPNTLRPSIEDTASAAPAETPVDVRPALYQEVDSILAARALRAGDDSTGLRVNPTEEAPYLPAEDVAEWTDADDVCIAKSLAVRLGE